MLRAVIRTTRQPPRLLYVIHARRCPAPILPSTMHHLQQGLQRLFGRSTTSSSQHAVDEDSTPASGRAMWRTDSGRWVPMADDDDTGDQQPIEKTGNVQEATATPEQANAAQQSTPSEPPPLVCGLDQLNFVDQYTHQLPGEPYDKVRSHTARWRIPNVCYSHTQPTPFKHAPKLTAYSADCAKLLDLQEPADSTEADHLAQYLAGQHMLPHTQPYAQRYAGWQFRMMSGQLGDGRACCLGQVKSTSGQVYEMQLKGSGLTPYSRQFDGRAVLRSSIREFLMSEHMHALGVPTTRALSLCRTDDKVMRNGFEPCAVVCRVAPSFLRIGSFEIHYYAEEMPLLQKLAEYTINTHFPDINTTHPLDSNLKVDDILSDSRPMSKRYAALVEHVVKSTAILIAHWMSVGFVHSVMNTDNISIHGLTLDYAPPSLLLDDYRVTYAANDTDDEQIYSFQNQPSSAQWALDKLCKAFTPLTSVDDLMHALNQFTPVYDEQYVKLMRTKLGLRTAQAGDKALLDQLTTLLDQTNSTDYTIFMRILFSSFQRDGNDDAKLLTDAGVDSAYHRQLLEWCHLYRQRLHVDGEFTSDSERWQSTTRHNPKYILRSYMLDEAASAAQHQRDYTMVNQLLHLATHPFDDQLGAEFDRWSKRPDSFMTNQTCSCSS